MRGVYTIWLRNNIRYFRSKSRIIGSLAQPLFFFLALGFGLNAAFAGTGFDYISFIVPGIVSMAILFSSIFSGIQIIWDKQFGFLKETLIAPVSRTSIMLGQTLGGATTSMVQGIFVIIIALLIGSISLSPAILIALGFMLLIGIAFTATGIAIASRMEDMQGFQLIMNFIIMPIFFLSGALFPLTNAPAILNIIAQLNPLAYGVEGVRYGLLGASAINPLVCFVVLTVFSIVMIFIGAYLFNKTKV